MSVGFRPGLALLVASTTALMFAGTVALAVWVPTEDTHLLDLVVVLLFVVSFAGVGYLVASRKPANPIGWIFSGMGFGITLAGFTGNYAQYGLVAEPGSLPAAEVAAWVGNWIWLAILAPIGFVLLLFPDGRPPSRRWRPVGWALAAGLAVWFVSQGFGPGPLSNAGLPNVDNPFGLEALEGLSGPLGAASGIPILGGVMLAAVAVVVRFRRSSGDERRQMEWLVYAGVTTIAVVCVELPLEAVLGADHPATGFLQLGMFVALDLIPIAIGVAILRYRLYDIELLINRTLVYASLTALLALVYFGGVVVLGGALRAATAQDNEVAVAVSTLAVAALFGPARARIQSFIDRRFYRSRYDAARTLEAFGGRLRDQVELEALRGDLLTVVSDTLRPSHASVWLRG